MKGLICYYSTTGNTRLACEYIRKKIKNCQFELFSLLTRSLPDLSGYSVIGFALFTDFIGPSQLFYDFVSKLKEQQNKYAFVFNTFGGISGRTLKAMARLVKKKGFTVVGGHSLAAPENYPPIVAGGRTAADNPAPEQLQLFDRFISDLDDSLKKIADGEVIKNNKIKTGLLNSLLPVLPRKTSKKMMGNKSVDQGLCTKCGICEKNCAYQAITMDPWPVFNQKKCYGCWACYNLCPVQAVYTKKLRKKGHYQRPLEVYRNKLK